MSCLRLYHMNIKQLSVNSGYILICNIKSSFELFGRILKYKILIFTLLEI